MIGMAVDIILVCAGGAASPVGEAPILDCSTIAAPIIIGSR